MGHLVRYLKLCAPYRSWMLFGVLLSLATLLSGIGLLALSGWFIAAMGLAGAAAATMNYFTPAAIIRALAIIRTGGRYAERLVTHDAALRTTSFFRQWFFERLYPLSLRETKRIHSGHIFSRMRADIDALERFYLAAIAPLGASAAAFAVMAAALAFFAPFLAVPLLGLLLAGGLVLPLCVLLRNAGTEDRLEREYERLRVSMTDEIQALGETLVYGGGDDRMQEPLAGIRQSQERLSAGDSLVQAGQLAALNLAVIAGALLAVPVLRQGRIDAASYAMMPLLCLAAFDIAVAMPGALRAVMTAAAAARRVFRLVDQGGRREDRKSPGPVESRGCAEDPGGAEMPPPAMASGAFRDFSLELRRASFAYEGGAPAFQDLDFTLPAAGRYVLAGPSGFGKSTLVHLLTGLLPFGGTGCAGAIIVNGKDIRAYAEDDLRAFFALSPQKPYFFNETLHENLLLAKPDATGAEIAEACEAACLTDFIAALPAGLDSMIGENAVRISGGEARRLSIARALLRPAPCLILDEPAEGLDREMAAAVMARIQSLCEKRGQALLICRHHRAAM